MRELLNSDETAGVAASTFWPPLFTRWQSFLVCCNLTAAKPWAPSPLKDNNRFLNETFCWKLFQSALFNMDLWESRLEMCVAASQGPTAKCTSKKPRLWALSVETWPLYIKPCFVRWKWEKRRKLIFALCSAEMSRALQHDPLNLNLYNTVVNSIQAFLPREDAGKRAVTRNPFCSPRCDELLLCLSRSAGCKLSLASQCFFFFLHKYN